MPPKAGAVDTRYDDDLDLTIVEVQRPVSYRDVLSIVRDEIMPRAAKNLMWVIHPNVLNELTTDDFKDFYASHRDSILKRAGGRTIYVALEDTEYMLCRWAKIYVERRVAVPIDVDVVRSIGEGLGLLGEADESHRRSLR